MAAAQNVGGSTKEECQPEKQEHIDEFISSSKSLHGFEVA